MFVNTKQFLLVTIFTFLSAASPAAYASEPVQAPYKMFEDVDITVGAGVAVGSEYVGGKTEVSPVPIIDITYGSWNLGFGGLRYGVIEEETYGVGVALNYDGGRDKKDLPNAKRGVGDVDSAAVTTIDAHYTMFDFLTASTSVSQYFRDDGGTTAIFGLDAGAPIYGEEVSVNIGVSTTWMSEDYAQTVFGVNSKQAAASGLKKFKADSGIQDVTLNAGINYNFAPSWNYTVQGGVEFLQGSAADSPIIEKESSPFLMTGVTYSF